VSGTFLIRRTNEREIIIDVLRSSRKVAVIPVSNKSLIFSTAIRKTLKQNFTKIRPMGAEMFHADGQRENKTKVIVAFRNFANATKK